MCFDLILNKKIFEYFDVKNFNNNNNNSYKDNNDKVRKTKLY